VYKRQVLGRVSAGCAHRVGAGLVALAAPDAVKPSAAVTCPEAIFLTLPESSAALVPPSQAPIVQWLTSAASESAALPGPGLSQAAPTAAFLSAPLGSPTGSLRSLVCDTDAPNRLARILT
jgi:NAD(P)H-hydrate repair Nnr-like enzyme with NAD(P)H-hydrate dehydratase domain